MGVMIQPILVNMEINVYMTHKADTDIIHILYFFSGFTVVHNW